MNEAFDELAKVLAEDVSRREALRRVGSVLATALLASVGLKTAWGACPPGKTLCSGKCVNLQTDNQNCGICGTVCPSGQSCGNGICIIGSGDGSGSGCPSGRIKCKGRCVDPATDPNNCRGCGIVCASGVCCRGVCCAAGRSCCDGTCLDTTTNKYHCGGCNITCTNASCVSGVCQCNYADENMTIRMTNCGGTCTDTRYDPQNCGGCGITCPEDRYYCSNGVCQCPPPTVDCSGTCVYLGTTANCSACGDVCGDRQICFQGRCECDARYAACGGACVDTATDNNNCGGCGITCPTGSSCVSGACQ